MSTDKKNDFGVDLESHHVLSTRVLGCAERGSSVSSAFSFRREAIIYLQFMVNGNMVNRRLLVGDNNVKVREHLENQILRLSYFFYQPNNLPSDSLLLVLFASKTE